MSEEMLFRKYVAACLNRDNMQKLAEQGVRIPATLYNSIVARKKRLVKLIAEGGIF